MKRLILFLWILCSCNPHHQEKSEAVLECLVDAYIEEFSMRLGNEISLFETHGWSDTTLLIRILTINSERFDSNEQWFSKYKSAKLYLAQGELFDSMNLKRFLDKERMISNNLKWKLISINNPNSDDNNIVPPEQFDEVQIVYNTKKKCFLETNMMGRLEFKQRIQSTCGLCE